MKKPLVFLIFSLFAALSTGFAQEISLLAGPRFSPSLAEAIEGAQSSVRLATYVFRLSPRGETGRLAKALAQAAKRGVEVEVYLETTGKKDSLELQNRQVAKWLKRNRIKVYFDGPNQRSHAKAAVIDHRLCFVGSHNLTEAALKHNYELTLRVDSPTLAQELEQSFNGQFR